MKIKMVEYRKLLVFSLASVLFLALLFPLIYNVPVLPVIEEYKHATLPTSDPVAILPRSDPVATLPINDPVVTLRDPVDPELHSREPCTMSSIQTYITQNDFFPDKGTWIMRNRKPLRWSPDLCSFKNPSDTINVKECFLRKNVKRVLVLGDSNGLGYFHVITGFVKRCTTLKTERGPLREPDISYFAKYSNVSKEDLRFQLRDCSGCKSQLKKCTLSANRSVLIEYVVMEYLMDTEVTTYREACPGQCLHSNTHQQFIFGEYLSANYPDLILLFSNVHDRIRKQRAVIKAEVNYLIELIRALVPASTEFVWLTNKDDDETKSPLKWQNVKYDGKYNNSFHTSLLNQDLFNLLKPAMSSPSGNIHGFFDLQAIVRDVLHLWSKGRVHLQAPWYKLVVHYLLQAFCN